MFWNIISRYNKKYNYNIKFENGFSNRRDREKELKTECPLN
jgi:hypothetical protein